MHDIKSVGVISKPGVKQAADLAPSLVAWLRGRGLEVRCDEETAGYVQSGIGLPRMQVPEGADLVIVLGGDGTLLSAARAVGDREIPIFPVNLGGLGFLTAISVDEVFEELERAFRCEHRLGRRKVLSCALYRDGAPVASYEALNDMVITKAALARMIDLDTVVDGHFMCAYKADGLIVSTPTGSTAYSLSAGGPIIFPSVGAWCITPISPHMLTNRPVIVPDSSVVQVTCRAADNDAYLTIDGQVGEPLRCGDQVRCQSAAHHVILIRPPKMRFFDVLREKLKWGER